MTVDTETTSAIRNRTRRAILDAAIQLLGENPAASLGEVADAAGVGRTTLHRYFPSRTDLLTELVVDINEQIYQATLRARPDDGLAADAIERLIEEYFDLADLMTFMINVPEFHQSKIDCSETKPDQILLDLVRRGHEDGSIDPELSPEWIAMELIWTTIFGMWDYVRSGRGTRAEARKMALRTITKAIAAPAS